MDPQIQPKPSNAHKPRVRLPTSQSAFSLYQVRVPQFRAEPLNDWMVRLVVCGYLSVTHRFDLYNAMCAAVAHTRFMEIRFGGAHDA